MLEKLFSSAARVKILTLFLTNIDNRYYIREIGRLTSLPIRAVQREAERMEEVGLLVKNKEANLVYYQVNKEFPLVPELKSIIFKTEALGSVIQKNLAHIGEIKFAFIYGSYAKGEEQAGSDIDLMVFGNVDQEKLHEVITKVEENLNREINYSIFGLDEVKKRIRKKDHFITLVLDEPKIMLIGKEDALQKIAA